MSAARTSREIRADLGHPVVDADGHWIEPVPVFCEYLDAEAGPNSVDLFRALLNRRGRWYRSNDATRRAMRIERPFWWGEPALTLDLATAKLPGLLSERLDEFGIDYAFVHPTMGLSLLSIDDSDLRVAACSAYNRMTVDQFEPHRHRLAPVAVVPVHTPAEGVAELRTAVDELGFTAIVTSLTIGRSSKTDPTVSWIDVPGMDTDDYDSFWAACVEHGVAVADHGGAKGWADRRSPSNFVANHIGHFAQARHATFRGLLFGGVIRRFPALNFALLEGGVAWARSLLLDVVAHWEKRNVAALEEFLSPSNVDTDELHALLVKYGSPAVCHHAPDLAAHPSTGYPTCTAEQLASRETDIDEFARLDVESADELVEIVRRSFYFGCEADDQMTALAFDDRMGPPLHAIFGSDIGHFDVPDMTGVLAESWELVEHGLLTPAEFRNFTFAHAVRLHGRMNSDVFVGTALEREAAALLTTETPARADGKHT